MAELSQLVLARAHQHWVHQLLFLAHCQVLLVLAVPDATEDRNPQEDQSDSQHNSEEGPFHPIASDQVSEGGIDLLISPLSVSAHKGQRDEFAVLALVVFHIPQFVVEKLHVVEDALISNETCARVLFHAEESVVIFFAWRYLITIGVNN